MSCEEGGQFSVHAIFRFYRTTPCLKSCPLPNLEIQSVFVCFCRMQRGMFQVYSKILLTLIATDQKTRGCLVILDWPRETLAHNNY